MGERKNSRFRRDSFPSPDGTICQHDGRKWGRFRGKEGFIRLVGKSSPAPMPVSPVFLQPASATLRPNPPSPPKSRILVGLTQRKGLGNSGDTHGATWVKKKASSQVMLVLVALSNLLWLQMSLLPEGELDWVAFEGLFNPNRLKMAAFLMRCSRAATTGGILAGIVGKSLRRGCGWVLHQRWLHLGLRWDGKMWLMSRFLGSKTLLECVPAHPWSTSSDVTFAGGTEDLETQQISAPRSSQTHTSASSSPSLQNLCPPSSSLEPGLGPSHCRTSGRRFAGCVMGPQQILSPGTAVTEVLKETGEVSIMNYLQLIACSQEPLEN